MKQISILVAGFAIFILFSFTNARSVPSPHNIRKVVIDAGHGGNDPGAIGSKYKEKNIALSIALKLGGVIKENFPEIDVIYTRTTDVFVELYNRAKIANENKADLFISIHCNSSKANEAAGTETWVMGLNKSEANLEVAKKENAAVLMEANYSSQYDGFDPNSPEANIIFSLYQNTYLDQSLNLAAKVQSQMGKRVGRVNRGVKQAGFLVLYKTTMPGILVETGFISNPEEEEYIGSDLGQSMIASGIYRAFKEYKNGIEGGETDNNDTVNDLIHVKHPPVKISDTSANHHKVNVIKPLKADTIRKSGSEQQIYFRVQFTTSSTQKPLNSRDFKGIQEVKVYFHDGLYKYTAGNEATLQSAARIQNEVQQKGFKDAFIIAFLNEERISCEEALNILKKQKK